VLAEQRANRVVVALATAATIGIGIGAAAAEQIAQRAFGGRVTELVAVAGETGPLVGLVVRAIVLTLKLMLLMLMLLV
jgi:hypothetical protein